MKNKEEYVNQKIRYMAIAVGLVNLIVVISLFASPIVWIWHGWDLAWKIALSSFILHKIINPIYEAIKKTLPDFDDEKQKLSFQQRLDEALNNQRKDKV